MVKMGLDRIELVEERAQLVMGHLQIKRLVLCNETQRRVRKMLVSKIDACTRSHGAVGSPVKEKVPIHTCECLPDESVVAALLSASTIWKMALGVV